MTYKLADGKAWPEREAELGRRAEETAKWSEEVLGQEALSLLYDTIAVTDRALADLKETLQGANDDDPPPELKAGLLLFGFAFGRVQVSWRLLKEGYLFDASGSIRAASESILRGAYCLGNPDTARGYLNGQGISAPDVRKAVAQGAEDTGGEPKSVVLKRLQCEWNALSRYSHSYTIEAIQLQTEVRQNGDITTNQLVPWGVKRPHDLLAFFHQLLSTLWRIPAALRHLSDAFEWPKDLVEEVDDVSQRWDKLEKQLLERLEALDTPSP